MAEDGKSQRSTVGPEGPAVEDPKIEDLARRLMDLWQEQMAAIAADPDLMRQMARMMAASPFPAMMQGIMQGVLAATAKSPAGPWGGMGGGMGGVPGQNPYEWWKGENGAKPTPPAQAPAEARPPAAAPASQPGGSDLAELRRNLASLEARLSELGAAGRDIVNAAKPGDLANPGPARPKPKRPARKPAKSVADPAGGGGENGAGGAGGGAPG